MLIQTSIVYAVLSGIGTWLMNQLKNSRLVACFLAQKDTTATVEGSIFYKIYHVVRQTLCGLFSALGFTRLFEGSIFKITYFWCFLPVVLAPFLPTMVVLALTAAGFGSLLLNLLCDKNKKLKHFAINKYIIIYAAIYLFATFTSVSPRGSLLGGLLTAFFLLFYFVVINSVTTRKQLDVLVFFFVMAGVFVSLYGFYQFMFPAKFSGVWHDTDMFTSIAFRVYSTLGNPNVLGEYFLLVIPIGFAYVLISKKLISKLIYLAACGVMMLCLILTYSRGCYVGILAAIGLFLVLLDRRFILLAVLGLLALPFVLPETIIDLSLIHI